MPRTGTADRAGTRVRVLGIDPGSIVTGYGVIDHDASGTRAVSYGVIKAQGDQLPARLRSIYDALYALAGDLKPDEVAVERVFVHRNVDSAIKLGQARGAALCAVFATTGVIEEYAPRQIKQAVVGGGAADKRQVQRMVSALLGLDEPPPADAADALAVAVCHAHCRLLNGQTASPSPRRRRPAARPRR